VFVGMCEFVCVCAYVCVCVRACVKILPGFQLSTPQNLEF
jgi:hypothetical protein